MCIVQRTVLILQFAFSSVLVWFPHLPLSNSSFNPGSQNLGNTASAHDEDTCDGEHDEDTPEIVIMMIDTDCDHDEGAKKFLFVCSLIKVRGACRLSSKL